ncbi:MAG: SET domain-containing protein-lysine N-methyltransferase [Bacteroidetes bacterium]|nr:SET domain-containing protein-lysine N-methyltransferase [Bacteroidota bacterium]
MILPVLCIAPSGKNGRGVFTSQPIPANKIIEISPVITLNRQDRKIVEKTRLFNYIFEWGKDNSMACIALGYVSMYNHHAPANCEYEMDFDTDLMYIRTLRAIKKGEELFVNYHAEPNNDSALWFQTK